MQQAVTARGRYTSTPCLNADVLWLIFSFNTFSDDHFTATRGYCYRLHPDTFLLTARYTSQVCRLWRFVILSTPEIWANILDFNYLQQKDDTWRNEILRRTGTALLSIIGHDLKKDAPGINSFFSLIRQEARRIRRIRVSTKGDYQGMAHDPLWTSIFFEEAPHLEIVCFQHFKAEGFNPISWNLSNAVPVLFCNKQTKIHTLIIWGFWISLAGPWARSIRQLDITMGVIESRFTRSLNFMPKLKSLCIKRCKIIEEMGQDVTIPNIGLFHFQTYHLHDAVAFLDLILPKEGSATTIEIAESKNDIISDQLQMRLRNGFIMQLRGRFSDKLSLILSDYQIELSSALTFQTHETQSATFTLSLRSWKDAIQFILLDTLLTSISTSVITRLNLCFARFNFGQKDAVDEAIVRLFKSLQSVEVLQTTVQNLPILTERIHQPEIYFPRLHTLVLKAHAQPITSTLVEFVKQRHSVGHPLKKIITIRCDRVYPEVYKYLRRYPDLEFL